MPGWRAISSASASYCETDVLNTYLIYLRFELMRGAPDARAHAEEVERVKALLRAGTGAALR